MFQAGPFWTYSPLPITNPSFITSSVRFQMTKAKKKRIGKRIAVQRILASGRTIPPKRHPPTFVPKDTPVLNSVSRDEQIAKAAEFDRTSAIQLKLRMEQVQAAPTARFHFDEQPSLMESASPKVRQLLQLSNGSQSEVVKAQKKKGMTLFQLRDGDTGSSAVQVIALTTRIQQMQRHMTFHRKDFSGKRGLEALFVRRRKVLDYMERKDFDSYRKVVKTLGLIR
jgi:small subunit ribosomal protein S15